MAGARLTLTQGHAHLRHIGWQTIKLRSGRRHSSYKLPGNETAGAVCSSVLFGDPRSRDT
jgi:hypothetical protein